MANAPGVAPRPSAPPTFAGLMPAEQQQLMLLQYAMVRNNSQSAQRGLMLQFGDLDVFYEQSCLISLLVTFCLVSSC